MTTEERRTALAALWRAVDLLVPRKAQAALDDLKVAIEATYNDHGDVRVAEARADEKRCAEEALAEAYGGAYRASMLAVIKRSDYRDDREIGDPEELRSIH